LIVVDSSAVIAHLLGEPESAAIQAALDRGSPCLISTVTLLECRVVLMRRFGLASLHELDRLLDLADMRVEPFDAEQSMLAFDAYRRFGRGSGHVAQLNFADCAAYALARSRDAALLFKGDDFRATDIRDALAS
jgi:ribonuclease VapC